MSTKLLIVADLQHFKFFTTKIDPLGRESLELVEDSDSLLIHQRLSEKVSDRKGNFQSSGGSGSGEDHHIAEEEERRRIKEIAKEITNVLQGHNNESWYFAAPKAINNQIVELLDRSIKENMVMNLHADLTKSSADDLLEHFKK
ncbi:host attachment protein [bacterium]|nr:host attachment protein [bacterium]MBU1883220.1 host attachment protein [bacterium]